MMARKEDVCNERVVSVEFSSIKEKQTRWCVGEFKGMCPSQDGRRRDKKKGVLCGGEGEKQEQKGND